MILSPDRIAQRTAAALQRPGAVERADGKIKFQCPQCLQEGHDAHHDNAAYFPDGDTWGCAVGGRSHWEAIRAVLDAGLRQTNGARPLDATTATAESSAPTRQAIIISAATVAPEAMTWIDPGRLAIGALTMAVGLPDQGKTLMACDLAARVSAGMALPPAPRTRDVLDRRRVLILTNEDTIATTMVPRLIAADADLTQIGFIQMVRNADGEMPLFTLGKDLDALEDSIETEHPALVIMDGLVGYLGPDVKSHNDADVRRVLSPFAAVLARTGTAGLGLMHPPKVTTNLHYYAGGSVAFTAVPRVVLGVAPDPDDPSDNPRRFLAKLKGNLYGRVPTLAYRIMAANDAAVPHLEWEPDPVTVNIPAVFSPTPESPEDRGSRQACETWLRSYLADGDRGAKEMEQAADAAGYKKMTVRRARERVCDSVKVGTHWVWRLRPTEIRR